MEAVSTARRSVKDLRLDLEEKLHEHLVKMWLRADGEIPPGDLTATIDPEFFPGLYYGSAPGSVRRN